MKRICAIFTILLFAAGLLIPLSQSDFIGGNVLTVEKRKTALFPDLIDDNAHYNQEFVSRLSKWVEDNLGCREFAINAYNSIIVSKLGIINHKRVLSGKDGWLFYKPGESVEVGRGKVKLTSWALAKIAKNQQALSDLLKDQGFNYVLVLTPTKPSVYPEKLWGKTDSLTTTMDQVEEYLHKHTDVIVVNTKKGLVKNKDKGKLFWKTDTHWTTLGAYYAYEQTLHVLNEKGILKNEQPAMLNYSEEMVEGDLANMVGRANLPEERAAQYTVGGYRPVAVTEGEFFDEAQCIQHKEISRMEPCIIQNNDSINPPLYILGDSQWMEVRRLPNLLAKHFSRVCSLRVNRLTDNLLNLDKTEPRGTIMYACHEQYIKLKLLGQIYTPACPSEESVTPSTN